jgi:hypothetical protein
MGIFCMILISCMVGESLLKKSKGLCCGAVPETMGRGNCRKSSTESETSGKASSLASVGI